MLERPRSSVIFNRIVNLPAALYSWDVFRPKPEVPSPKSQAKDWIVPAGSDEPDASSATARGALPRRGVMIKEATGSA